MVTNLTEHLGVLVFQCRGSSQLKENWLLNEYYLIEIAAYLKFKTKMSNVVPCKLLNQKAGGKDF